MKATIPLLLLTAAALQAAAEPRPLRVLHLGKPGTASADHCHVLMRELGRDAIWFEYADEAAAITPEWLAHFDAVISDGTEAPAQAGNRVVKIEFTGDEAAWGKPEFIAAAKAKILTAAGADRAKGLEAFLAQREPEKREPNPNVANYERRPEPLTFQHPFSVKGSLERTQVAPDLKIELFAAEPDISKPIAVAWDERGRAWVAETRDYPHGPEGTEGSGNDSIKICEDTNGDGKADKFTVFADKLHIPTSLVFAGKGLIVSQPPRFLYLEDTDGDDKADVRKDLITGWGIGDTHAQASSLHYGYDNWIYGCVGYSGYEGNAKPSKFAMGTYRFRPDGTGLEFLHQFSNNSWGHSQNAAGDQFGGTANGAPLFYGGIPASIVPQGMRAMTAKKINEVDRVNTITPNYRQVDVFGGYTSAAGSSFIYSDKLPERLQGMVMVCEPTMKTVSLMKPVPKGAGYTAKDGFNLVASTDEWMSPVFAEVGPDGAVWIADWQNFIIQHNPTPSAGRGGYDAKTGVGGAHENPLRDHSRGRIYRVMSKTAKDVKAAPLKAGDTAGLVAALSSQIETVRTTAQRLLVSSGASAAALLPVLQKGEAGQAAIHALWTLHGLGQLTEDQHRAALLSKSPELRRNAIRALGSDEKSQALYFGAGVVSDPDLITRLAAYVKLAEFPTTPEIQTMVKALSRSPEVKADEWLTEAVRVLTKVHKAEAFKEGPNLLPNPGLENVGADGLPEGWKRRDYGGQERNAGVEWSVVSGPGNARSGEKALRCISRGNREADTSFYADVTLKPDTMYRLSGWVKGKGLRGKISLNDHIGRAETDRVTRSGDWTPVQVEFNSGSRTQASINILHVASGEGYFDDVKLCELIPEEGGDSALAGDAKRGEEIFLKHPVAACVLCHQLKGAGSTVGPPMDGIASKQTKEYIHESLVEPNKILAKGYEQLGASPMPPMGIILKPQELADIEAFLQTLK